MARRFILLTCLAFYAAAGSAQPVVAGALASGHLLGPAIRTVLSLLAVLAVLGACAWFVRRMRQGGAFKSGLIEVISGISLGNREKVVVLRIGNEQIVVGVSPAGMTSLHVISTEPEDRSFSECMERSE